MDITIQPRILAGSITAIPSKSHAHRLLICSALADGPTNVICPEICSDIEATAQCLSALGAEIQRNEMGYHVIPVKTVPKRAALFCRESGATLRFLLPVVAALGVDASFFMEGRLADRPLHPLWKEMEHHGCKLEWQDNTTLHCTGKLQSGCYHLPGDVSSQFISGLMIAFPLMRGVNTLDITGPVQSRPYVELTQDVLSKFGIGPSLSGTYHSPGTVTVEGDWSNAAFFFGASAIGNRVHILGLDASSHQGDKAISTLLKKLETHATLDISNYPDLVPILTVIAAANEGSVFTNIARLRLKESDRVSSIVAMLGSLGIIAESTEHTLTIHPGTITGGIVDSFCDHRIAMAAAIAATAASGPVTIRNADCVVKSYPRFWKDYQALGGHYEFDLR